MAGDAGLTLVVERAIISLFLSHRRRNLHAKPTRAVVDVCRCGVISHVPIPLSLPDLLGTKRSYRPICWIQVHFCWGQRDAGGRGALGWTPAGRPLTGGGWAGHPQLSRLE